MQPRLPAAALVLSLGACASTPPTAIDQQDEAGPSTAQFVTEAGHSPPFARLPYAPFTRAEAVAIAEQEWRLFGQRVDDSPPRSASTPDPVGNVGRLPGSWERIGEYWWLGQNSSRRESAWTGIHDETGQEFDEGRQDYYAWSAAFISYVMRTAGAGARFPYAPSHYVYINVAKQMQASRASGWAIMAERVDQYAPVPGDLICYSRERRPVKYEKLPVRRFAGHCDMVVARGQQQISVIGGNVDHAVTMKHVPVTPQGLLADPGGPVLDSRYSWFVVLRVLYDR